ncbi:hypothetical protein KPZU09_21050 [Klebsiella pneumoniae]|uniref:Uncharacterized protein n=1 Tax=Klebsiella pneumoniae TaxID=573 RepID=A0A919HUC6_KLEPN|nr:hypothetical protein KPZU09_21050 [Klebsiella pneumoniae]
MTQPDRRHLRRARLALAVVVAAALAAAVVPGGRTFLQQSLTALASRIRSRSEGLSPPGAAGRAGLICADDPPGDRRSAAGFPDYPGERRPVRRLLGRALSWFSAMAGAGLCFCIARALGREVVEKLTGRAVLRSADGYFTRFGPQTIWSAACCRLSRLTRSAMPPD